MRGHRARAYDIRSSTVTRLDKHPRSDPLRTNLEIQWLALDMVCTTPSCVHTRGSKLSSKKSGVKTRSCIPGGNAAGSVTPGCRGFLACDGHGSSHERVTRRPWDRASLLVKDSLPYGRRTEGLSASTLIGMSTVDVSQDQLRALLAEQAESPSLEYIGDCDLDERRDTVELATEVGALAARGGWLVIGSDDHGDPSGLLDERKAGLFDEAKVRDKLSRYLPATLDLRVGCHQVDAGWAVLIHVGAHPDGAVVFIGDGTYDEKGSSRTAFRKGEFFVRHGTKSERPTQDDVSEIGRSAVEKARLWLAELHRPQT